MLYEDNELYFDQIDEEDESLRHYGTPRHSGRYPWGSGENPYQHSGGKGFLSTYRSLQQKGLSDKEIAEYFHINTKALRNKKTIELAKEKLVQYDQIEKRVKEGKGWTQIARELNMSEGTVRSRYLRKSGMEKAFAVRNTADALAEEVKRNKYVDIGKASNLYMNVAEDRFDAAVEVLRKRGYGVETIHVEQGTSGNYTTVQVLTEKKVSKKEIWDNRDKIQPVGYRSEDGKGLDYKSREPIVNISRDRVMIRYSEDGGTDKDGTIEIRRGVKDLDLGRAHYAQVRIGVENESGPTDLNPKGLNHYLKGMAMYADDKDFPPGCDIIVNSNKHRGAPDDKVFKIQTDPDSVGYDPSNPFKAAIKTQDELQSIQTHYEDKNGKQKLSALNIVNEEGAWGEWKKTLASQMLSKQDPELARRQLELAATISRNELEKIMDFTQPTIKRELLMSFGDECDAKAVHLKAAALPRQRTKVILPFNEVKDNEVYAPDFKQGEEVILIRYPHEGIFEIPRLKVNNNIKSAVETIGKNPKDAIGISPKTASILSGADFDGDTVLCIPTKGYNLKAADSIKATGADAKALESLKSFDPDSEFPESPRSKPWKKGGITEHTNMGKISNLITDMTIKQASIEEIVRATKYSMLIIDVAKHHYDYKKAYEDLGIKELKDKYQSGGGADTLISSAKGQTRVPVRKEITPNPETGEKQYLVKPPLRYKVNKQGEEEPVYKTFKSTKMAEAKDAYELSSGYEIENIYADYANYMKAMGNEARKAALAVKDIAYQPEAAKTYAKERDSLSKKLYDAHLNAPIERKARLLASKKIEDIEADEDMDEETAKKEKKKALAYAREVTGAKKNRVYVDDKEWEAIQNGAITKSMIKEIWDNGDQDRIKELALPKESREISDKIKARIQRMAGNYTTEEIANYLGISTSTVQKYI